MLVLVLVLVLVLASGGVKMGSSGVELMVCSASASAVHCPVGCAVPILVRGRLGTDLGKRTTRTSAAAERRASRAPPAAGGLWRAHVVQM